MPATSEEIKQYVTNKLQNETTEELVLIREATIRQLPTCQPEHLLVLENWIQAIDEVLNAKQSLSN